MQLFGGRIDVDEHGDEVVGDTMLMLFNADHASTISFHMPPAENGWIQLFDTARPDKEEAPCPEPEYNLEPCSMAVFRSPFVEKEAAE